MGIRGCARTRPPASGCNPFGVKTGYDSSYTRDSNDPSLPRRGCILQPGVAYSRTPGKSRGSGGNAGGAWKRSAISSWGPPASGCNPFGVKNDTPSYYVNPLQ